MLEAPGFSGLNGIGPFTTDGQNLYDLDGQVFAASSGTPLESLAGTNNFNPVSAVMTESNSGRTFLLSQYNGFAAYDSAPFAQVGATYFHNIYSAPNRVRHRGQTGFRSSHSTLIIPNSNAYDQVLFRSPWLYLAPGPNPVPVLSAVPHPRLQQKDRTPCSLSRDHNSVEERLSSGME